MVLSDKRRKKKRKKKKKRAIERLAIFVETLSAGGFHCVREIPDYREKNHFFIIERLIRGHS